MRLLVFAPLMVVVITSCSVGKRTVRDISVAVKDTVYVERSAQTDKYSRDTLIIERVVTEYYPDTAGNWIPARRSIAEGKEVATHVSTGTETEKISANENSEMQAKSEEVVIQRSFSRWRWFMAGAITMLVLLIAGYIVKRVYFTRLPDVKIET